MDMQDGKGKALRIGLVGDFDPEVPAHQAIPLALDMGAVIDSPQVQHQWLPTPEIGEGEILTGFDGIWCVPASPYRDMQGALTAIRFARERQIPFLGTCGGFQHALIEYARNCLGWQDAEHAETSPDSPRTIITPLSCSLVETTAAIKLLPDSLIAQAYGTSEIAERYRCRYGLRPELEGSMFGHGLKVSGRGPEGDIRSIELQGHPFFVATLFQPERAALQGVVPALVAAFVRACARCAEGNCS
ncbi:CTP synthase C-terminal region-related (seleno)protein [Pseudomonas capsici]|uniref:CTP synthase (glutamine hydrolyzing) n=1 Tax=Pseudomonas capsici TaxID=2810614 RepID=A0ABT3BVL9_9PSED|nr:CTP synthase [Pseudomonas capsici]MCV4268091.1 CTP synthase [Pseudomonas capsici]MCV4278856.1 CTP synthase [Pseudomonas capsici]MCV4332088.1 CTP synthase [Pseudomonas capsici]MCV4376894.1 CTP synthase [Pseudomonas capsici]